MHGHSIPDIPYKPTQITLQRTYKIHEVFTKSRLHPEPLTVSEILFNL